MKKIIFTLLLSGVSIFSYAQVGIGTNTPDNSAMLEIQTTTKGILFPRMTSVQRTAIATPANGLYVFDTNTKSLWYYNGSFWVNTADESTLGDVKSGFQTADHSGWIKLDGRAINTLTASQQAVASSLGFTTNLPDATTAYLVQDNGTMGNVSGSNSRTIAQSNLPNVNFTGTTSSDGAHTHTVDPVAFNSANNGNHAHTVDPTSVNTSTDGWHTHGSNATGAGTGLAYIDCWGTPSGIDVSCNEINNYVTLALDIYGSGNHFHSVDIPSTTSSTNGDHAHSIDVPSTTSSSNGAHTHTVTVSSGGSGTALSITPKSLTVNMFVYLGL
jgi:hypothetical protein